MVVLGKYLIGFCAFLADFLVIEMSPIPSLIRLTNNRETKFYSLLSRLFPTKVKIEKKSHFDVRRDSGNQGDFRGKAWCPDYHKTYLFRKEHVGQAEKVRQNGIVAKVLSKHICKSRGHHLSLTSVAPLICDTTYPWHHTCLWYQVF